MADSLGTLVKKARAEKGWTQAQLAAKIKGMSASDIGKIERGEKIPDTEQIRTLAKTLGVTQTSLLNAAKGKASGAKTSSAKTGSAKTSSAKKGSGKTAASKTSVTVTAEEKKMLQLYRKADDATKAAVEKLLSASASVTSATGSDNVLGDLLGSVLGQLTGKK